ncbi:hypothetical protein SNE510_07970 [Streptomyces sp. NE5-10]|nr:hypothetical protein SNE510_07970 [Streptomyces sp. NE5-10]
MRRGEIRWAVFDERRPVVLLSDEEPSGFRAVQVVAPAGVDLGDLGVEVPVGPRKDSPSTACCGGPSPTRASPPCTWATTVTRDDLTERAGTLSSATLDAVEAALRRAARPSGWAPATAARFDAMRAALRPGAVDG